MITLSVSPGVSPVHWFHVSVNVPYLPPVISVARKSDVGYFLLPKTVKHPIVSKSNPAIQLCTIKQTPHPTTRKYWNYPPSIIMYSKTNLTGKSRLLLPSRVDFSSRASSVELWVVSNPYIITRSLRWIKLPSFHTACQNATPRSYDTSHPCYLSARLPCSGKSSFHNIIRNFRMWKCRFH